MITYIIMMALRGENFMLYKPLQFSNILMIIISVTIANRYMYTYHSDLTNLKYLRSFHQDFINMICL